MEANTGYVITRQNVHLIATLTGIELVTVEANIGWVAWYQDYPRPRWSLVPKNVADRNPDFHYVDSVLNGLPTRSEKAIREEWAQVNKEFGDKIDELKKELERALLRDGEGHGSNNQP